MNEKQKGQILGYITESFIIALSCFQTFVIKIHQPLNAKYIEVSRVNRDNLISISFQQLKNGHNDLIFIQTVILRWLEYKDVSFILAEDLSKTQCPQYIFIIMFGYGTNVQQIETGKRVNIIQPFISGKCGGQGSQYKICLSRFQNAVFDNEKQVEDSNEFKIKGNNLFNQKNYLHALVMYEIALRKERKMMNIKNRAILYSNSCACFYQMSLYQTSLTYSNIAIRIDPSYPKGYVRKFNNLLEMKMFSKIPKCLMSLAKNVERNELQRLNRKYCNYVSNSQGKYDWLTIYSNPINTSRQLGEYTSQLICKSSSQQNYYFYSNSEIKEAQILMVRKPIYSFRSPNRNIEEYSQIIEQIIHHSSIQKSFDLGFRHIIASNITTGLYLKKQKIFAEIQKYFILQRPLEFKKSDCLYGVWKDLLNFKQNCQSNCNFGNFKTALVVFAARDIAKGQILTLDLIENIHPARKKQAISKNTGLLCKCAICSLTNWPTSFNNQSIVKIMNEIKQLKCIKLKKNILWYTLCQCCQTDGNSNMIENMVAFSKLLDEYLCCVSASSSWWDILNILGMIRQEDTDHLREGLKQFVIGGFMKFLKMSRLEAQSFYKIVK